GTGRVATVHSIGLYELSTQIKRYLKAYPQVHLHLAYSRSSRIYEDISKGNVDVGVVAYPARRPGITVLPFRNDRLVLVCPPHHAFASHRRVSIRKLSGEALVGFEGAIPSRQANYSAPAADDFNESLRPQCEPRAPRRWCWWQARSRAAGRARRAERRPARTCRPSGRCTARRSARTCGRARARRAALSTASASIASRRARARPGRSSSTSPACT